MPNESGEQRKSNKPAALWEGVTASGKPKFSLKVEESLTPGYWTIVRNSYKQPGENTPDWYVMPRDDDEPIPAPLATSYHSAATLPLPLPTEPEEGAGPVLGALRGETKAKSEGGDDIPF